MRIALVSEQFPPDAGGLAVSAGRLACSLAAAQHTVEVFAPSKQVAPGAVASEHQAGVHVRRLGAHQRTDDTLADLLAALVAAHETQPYDLFHGFYLVQAGFVAAYAGHYTGTPSVVSARGNDLDRAVLDPGKAAHVLYALQHADAVTANSRQLARKAEALAPGRIVTLVPNGVDHLLFAPSPRDEALAQDLDLGGRRVLGFIGEARAKKGLATLLLAYAAVAEQLAPAPAPALLLVGGVRADAKDTLRVFRKQNPALPVPVVDYLPPAALPAYYNLLDVLVLPSLRDGLPNALLEGMACGRAVVGAAVGGLPDALHDGKNGCLVPPGDVAATAAAVAGLLADPARRAQFGQAARATILRDFTPERELALNVALYQRLVQA